MARHRGHNVVEKSKDFKEVAMDEYFYSHLNNSYVHLTRDYY